MASRVAPMVSRRARLTASPARVVGGPGRRCRVRDHRRAEGGSANGDAEPAWSPTLEASYHDLAGAVLGTSGRTESIKRRTCSARSSSAPPATFTASTATEMTFAAGCSPSLIGAASTTSVAGVDTDRSSPPICRIPRQPTGPQASTSTSLRHSQNSPTSGTVKSSSCALSPTCRWAMSPASSDGPRGAVKALQVRALAQLAKRLGTSGD